MPIGITDEHRELEEVVAAFAARHQLLRDARSLLDAPAAALPSWWGELASLGWLGIHLPESHGGQGYGLTELGVIVEQLGKAAAAGPFLPTVIVSAVLASSDDEAVKRRWLPSLADGSTIAGVGFGSLVLGGDLAQLLLVARGDDMVLVEREQATVTERSSLDHTRRLVEVSVAADTGVVVGRRSSALAIARSLAAAEAAGISRACLEMATEYAKVRVQFGRVIGSFMAVKHHCANMKVHTELASAAAWDGVRTAAAPSSEGQLAAAAAAAVAFPAALFCSQMNVQLHGGIGYTWEHDAHLYMRRAGALAALFGPSDACRHDVFELSRDGVKRHLTVELPPEADVYRRQVREFLVGFTALSPQEQRKRLVDSGYLNPHWPKPYGRSAGAVEQLVIDEEFGDVERPDMSIGGWVTLTFTQHGSEDQVKRWTRPSMLGETEWCQMFSEPNAGSDAAGIQTRATKVEGGWVVNGQKLWTSGAQRCTHGFATVRTDPDAPKHAGVTMMAIDLKAKGVTIRPLRSIAGHAGFNEIFLDNVFVPDDDVVGPINGGWTVARATLGNERVSIGSGRVTAREVDHGLLVRLADQRHRGDRAVACQVGELLAEDHAMKLMNLRSVARAVMGVEPSPEGNITKLLNSEHGQRVAQLALTLSGELGAVTDDHDPVAQRWVSVRSLTIAGGTSEISRNQIGERLLGLPREPGLR